MEPALADSVRSGDDLERGGLALATAPQTTFYPESAGIASFLLPASPETEAEADADADADADAEADGRTAPRRSGLVLSTDLADAERILAVTSAIADGFAPELSCHAPRTTGAETERLEFAPFVKSVRRTARYRIPRRAKRQLLDRFCGLTEARALRTLMVIAHPDDESIGGGARLAELSEAWVAYSTNGSPRNPDVARRHSFETPTAYAEQRRREAIAALSLAGVDEDRVRWLGLDDGEASRNLVDLCLRMAELVDTIQPHVVVTHPYEGGHTDHDATAFAVHLACGILRREGVRPPAVFELTSYNAANGERVVQEFLPHKRADLDGRQLRLGRRQRELKQKMFDCFTTQQAVMRQFDPGVEKFRPAPRYVFTRPPHPGVLNYERYGDPALGMRFRECAEEALRELRLRRSV